MSLRPLFVQRWWLLPAATIILSGCVGISTSDKRPQGLVPGGKTAEIRAEVTSFGASNVQTTAQVKIVRGQNVVWSKTFPTSPASGVKLFTIEPTDPFRSGDVLEVKWNSSYNDFTNRPDSIILDRRYSTPLARVKVCFSPESAPAGSSVQAKVVTNFIPSEPTPVTWKFSSSRRASAENCSHAVPSPTRGTTIIQKDKTESSDLSVSVSGLWCRKNVSLQCGVIPMGSSSYGDIIVVASAVFEGREITTSGHYKYSPPNCPGESSSGMMVPGMVGGSSDDLRCP